MDEIREGGPMKLFDPDASGPKPPDFKKEVHPHDIRERTKNLTRKPKDSSPLKNVRRGTEIVESEGIVRVHPEADLRFQVDSFSGGRVPILQAGTLFQTHVGWYRLNEDVGVIADDYRDFKNLQRGRGKSQKRRIGDTDDTFEYPFHAMRIPARAIHVETLDPRDFKNLYKNGAYVSARFRREPEIRKTSLGVYKELWPDQKDRERGHMVVWTKPSFLTTTVLKP